MSGDMKILVVDRDPNLLSLTSSTLLSGGYEVMRASTGKGALEAIAKAQPDLVLLDVVLSDMSGLEVCRQIKTDPALQSTIVVLLSEPDIPDEVHATGFELGIDGFVVKGIPYREFLPHASNPWRSRGRARWNWKIG